MRKLFLLFISFLFISASCYAADFDIVDGTLVKYNGKGGNVVIPTGVTRIGDNAFYECSSLISVSIPTGVTYIGSNAFGLCINLISVSMPSGVTYIGPWAFQACESLISVSIPDEVTSIGFCAFSSCPLTSIFIPRNVTTINYAAFAGCTKMESITVDSNNPEYSSNNGILYDKAKTILITCPGGKSGSILIPDGVTSIISYAFNNCRGLTSISIPNSVTSIEVDAFVECRNLEDIYVLATTPPTTERIYSFDERIYTDCTLYVPVGAKQIYEKADGWKEFSTIIEIIDTIDVQGVNISSSSLQMKIGERITLSATITPENATNQNITWSSSDETIATVSESGEVTAINTGEAIITVTTEDGNFSANCEVIVEKEQEKPVIEIEENEPAGQNGQGSINVSFNIPSDESFEGTFNIELPTGFSLNLNLSSLAKELANNYTLSIMPLENNHWELKIVPKALRAASDLEYQKIVNLIYDIDNSVNDGNYQAVITDLNFDFESGYSISEDNINLDLTVDHSFVGIDKVDSYLSVYVQDGNLYIDSPIVENISIYAVTGVLLKKGHKQASKEMIPLRSISPQVLIVKGSSGWTQKIVGSK